MNYLLFCRHSALTLVLFILLFALLPGALAQDAEPTPDVAMLGEGELNISYWNGLSGSDGVTMNEMLADFVVDNPDISVTSEIIPWITLYAKLQAAFVAGNPPDLILMHASEVPQYASYGVVKDLGYMYESGGGWFPDDDVSDVTFAGMQWDGTTYGIPLDNHGRGLWINSDHFEAAGLDPNMDQPTTFEGWVELFQQLTLDANGNNPTSDDFDVGNVVQWAYGVGNWPLADFLTLLIQHGGSMVSEDGSTITINSEAGIKALSQYHDLVYEYQVSPPAAGFDTWGAFAAGQLAVIPTGTWFRNFFMDHTDINGQAWTTVQFGENPSTWFGIHTFLLPDSLEGEKLAAVERLLQWISDSDNQVYWAGSGQVPARLSAQAVLDPENYPSNIVMGQSFTDYGFPDFNSTVTQELYAALDPELDAVLNGLKSVEDALNDGAARMQAILDRAG